MRGISRAMTGSRQQNQLLIVVILSLATTAGFGPRFLHSTGQLHKGGKSNGLFLQIVDEAREALPVPEADFTFSELIHAQAQGDAEALQQRKQRVLRVTLGRGGEDALMSLLGAVRG